MRIKSRGGHVTNVEFHYVAEVGKKPFERFNVLGPFEVDGKDFVAVAYFPIWSYWRWVFNHGLIILISFFNQNYYLKSTNLAALVNGMLTLDDDADLVVDRQLQVRIATVALPWIDVYINPVFPPKLFSLIDATAKPLHEIFEQCKKRRRPHSTNVSERFFYQQLRKADEQVIRFYPIFLKYHRSMKNACNLFNQISERPSEKNVMALKSVTHNLALRYQDLAAWCEERAMTWPGFVDAVELHRMAEDRKKTFSEKYGPKMMWRCFLSILAYTLSGGNFAISLTFNLVTYLGTEGFKTILSFRWQAKMLKKGASRYRKFAKRAMGFLELYNRPLEKDFLR